MKLYSICGKKGCGKTTLLEKLVAELRSRGLRVGVVKNDHHGFEMDQPGKDTWRLKRAGAASTMIIGPERVGLVMDVDPRPGLEEAVLRWFGHMDLVLAEGFSRSTAPKVEVFRPEAHAGMLLGPEQGLGAVATDAPGHTDVRAAASAGVAVFGLEDAGPLADWLPRG